MWLTQEPPCRFQTTCFQLSRLHGFRNLSRWERFGFVEREGSPSNSFHLALATAMVTFSYFLGYFHRPIPVRYNWNVFAREMHSTSEFAMIVLSKCVEHLSRCKTSTFCIVNQTQGDWSRFAYPVQRSYGISVDEWSDQPLVPALFSVFVARGEAKNPNIIFVSTRLLQSEISFDVISNQIYLFFFYGHGAGLGGEPYLDNLFIYSGALSSSFGSLTLYFGTLWSTFCSRSQLLELHLKGCIQLHGGLPYINHLVWLHIYGI